MFTAFKQDYAYGFIVHAPSSATFNRRQIVHGGGINGFSSSLARYPDDRVMVVVLSNLESPLAGSVSRDLAAILFGEKYQIPAERKVATINPAVYDAYVGKYQLAPGFVLTVTREGDRFMTQATGQDKVEVFPEGDTRFFLKVVDAQIDFVRDEKGKVVRLILHQGGRDVPAAKIE